MRISDWSSDVCSSDLPFCPHRLLSKIPHFPEINDTRHRLLRVGRQTAGGAGWVGVDRGASCLSAHLLISLLPIGLTPNTPMDSVVEIGRASCRERVCQYV